jgi:ABC-type nitrate/sulfonate/bicarbonate transport system substrate-binding protein
MKATRKLFGAAVLAVLGSLIVAGPAVAQDAIKVKLGRISFPTMITMMVDVVKEQGLDRKHGLDLEVKSYGAVSAYYAAQATGEIDVGGGGPHVLQKMRNEGVSLKGLFTLTRLTSMAVITADPAIRAIADLRGKTVAADMGSSEYQILAIYGRSQGVVFGKDVTVVQSSLPLARTQLQAKRVDAAMTWEPAATLTLRDNPQYRILVNGETAWSAVSKTSGWQLLVVAREDFLRRHPEAVPRLLRMFQDGQRLIQSNPDEADRIVQRTVKMPEGVFKEAIASRRLVYDILPAWESERSAIWDMFRMAVTQGYLDRLPDDGVLYTP